MVRSGLKINLVRLGVVVFQALSGYVKNIFLGYQYFPFPRKRGTEM